MEEKVNKKRSYIKIIIIIAVVCFFVGILAAVFIFVTSGSGTNKLRKHLELGEKYLNEMDYDNAILAYEKALEIDPKSIEAYKGIIEAYSEKGDENKAEYWAEKGFTETNDQVFLSEKEADRDGEIIEDDQEKPVEDEIEINLEYQIGEKFYYGSYEQDGDLTNGPEPIEWEVISVDGNNLLCWSTKIIDSKEFDVNRGTAWENCSLREWLNRDFYNNAFSEEEKDKILYAHIKNTPHPYWNNNAGNDTNDFIYLLSADEVIDYIGFEYEFVEVDDIKPKGGLNRRLLGLPTQYAIDQGCSLSLLDEAFFERWDLAGKEYANKVMGNVVTSYWLRTACSDEYVCYVGGQGAFSASGATPYGGSVGIRPAFYYISQ